MRCHKQYVKAVYDNSMRCCFFRNVGYRYEMEVCPGHNHLTLVLHLPLSCCIIYLVRIYVSSYSSAEYCCVWIIHTLTQNKGKESEISYQKLKRSQWTGTVCLSTVISSIFGKSSHFPFPYFVLFVLWYFPFQVVRLCIH